jgi:hypothetical protein
MQPGPDPYYALVRFLGALSKCKVCSLINQGLSTHLTSRLVQTEKLYRYVVKELHIMNFVVCLYVCCYQFLSKNKVIF